MRMTSDYQTNIYVCINQTINQSIMNFFEWPSSYNTARSTI